MGYIIPCNISHLSCMCEAPLSRMMHLVVYPEMIEFTPLYSLIWTVLQKDSELFSMDRSERFNMNHSKSNEPAYPICCLLGMQNTLIELFISWSLLEPEESDLGKWKLVFLRCWQTMVTKCQRVIRHNSVRLLWISVYGTVKFTFQEKIYRVLQ